MTSSRPEIPQEGPEPIAVVGVGCWLPGGINTLEALHEALREGRDLITAVPADRWNVDAYYDPDPLTPGKTYVRRGGFVQDVDKFDAGFFNISGAEAARIDPQQRMVLQTVWHALEHAGQAPEELERSNAGVFLAMMNTNGYAQLKALYEGLPGVTAYDAMGDAMSITAGRISHFLGLEGPALALDTACSSSLVALHVARQSLLAGDCDTAIVVGVNAILHPGIHIAFSKVGLMSRAGRCAAFDASADGYIRGEGCVAVILRRQSQAVARGDNILASIVGTAVNQDGRTPAVTAPNGRSQEKVIRSALARVGLSPSEIGYVEAHGTGTPVGDPIEMSAIANVFGPGRGPNEKLYVGSVKSNFGHIEAGAGLLGLAKVALSLQQEQIFPSLHFKQFNPNIDLGRAPVEVPTAVIPWPRGAIRRMVGINSFGYSGTNAHAIVQEAPPPANGAGQAPPARPNELVVLSAKSKVSLEELVDRWLAYLEGPTAGALANIAFTAGTGRSHLHHRLAAVGGSPADLAGKLRTWRDGRIAKGLASGQVRPRLKPKVAFMFTGQGAQYAGMAEELYKTEARFAETIDRVASLMDEELGVPLKAVLFGPESKTYLSNTRYVQPALFAVEYALADLLRYWGVEPDFVIGHSVGEIAAACVADVLDLEDAIRFVVARGRLMGALPEGGKMVAIGTDVEHARQWIAGREAEVSIATVNGPQSVVISGRGEAVDAVAELAQEAGLRTTPLEVSHAFHSPLMDPILAELAEVAASMHIAPARIPIVSNVTGDFYADRIEPAYWADHVRQAVLFHAGMEKVVEAGAVLLVEIGPHPALTPAVATAFDTTKTQPVPTLKRDGKDLTNVLGALALLYTKGASLKFERLFWSEHYRRLSLPLYPFRKDHHWLKANDMLQRPAEARGQRQPAVLPPLPTLHPLLGKAIARTAEQTVFEISLSPTSPWTDHRVLGTTVFPGTAYLDMAARGLAAAAGADWQAMLLKDVTFERPLTLAYRKPKTVHLIVENGANGSGDAHFRIVAADNENEVFCQGHGSAAPAGSEQVPAVAAIKDQPQAMPIGTFYGDLRKVGLEYGAMFANVRDIWFGAPGSGQAIGRVALAPTTGNGAQEPYTSAVLLDASLHVFGAALKLLDTNGNGHAGAYVPASVQTFTLRQPLPRQVWSEVTLSMSANGKAALANIRVLNDAGEVLADFLGLELRQVESLAVGKAAGKPLVPKAALTGLGAKSRAEMIDFLRPLGKRERVGELVKWLTAEIKDTMGQTADGLDLDTLPATTAFVEIGLDSLLVTELQRRIQEKLEFRFKPMQGLDYQSIDTMAEYLHDQVLAKEWEAQPA